jgi:non-ribosomal peptide synthetase component F
MGCGVVIAQSEQMKDVEAVRNLIMHHGVTCMTTVPSMFQVLVTVLQQCGVSTA